MLAERRIAGLREENIVLDLNFGGFQIVIKVNAKDRGVEGEVGLDGCDVSAGCDRLLNGDVWGINSQSLNDRRFCQLT